MESQRRFDFSALQEATGLGPRQVAEAANLERTAVYRWAREGLTDAQADRLACAVGLVPYLVWDDYLEAGLDAYDDHQRRQKYAATKRWRRRHPKKARDIQARWQKQYYKDNAERIRARQRAYYKANREREVERKRRARAEAKSA